MPMHVLAVGGSTPPFTSLLHRIKSITGDQPVAAASLSAAQSQLDGRLFSTLVLNLDSVVESDAETLAFLQRLTVSGRVRRLCVVCENGIPISLSPVMELMLACHLPQAATDSHLESMLGDGICGNCPDDFRETPLRRIDGGSLSFWTRMPELFSTLTQIERIAEHDVTILLVGETGTGKTHLARLMHALSSRRDRPFHNTACGALPRDIIESELFGHVRGAFTGADRNKIGRFEAAGDGTLLLDEIDALSANEQAKLLHVIETGEFQPVGGPDLRTSKARLIAASNVDLRDLVAADRFRSDLYFRLSVLEFKLPPLRQRPFDILPLAVQFIHEASVDHGLTVARADVAFLRQLLGYEWLGNIRELRNQMRRVVLLARDRMLTTDLLSPTVLGIEETPIRNRRLSNGTESTSDRNGNRQRSPWKIGDHLYESEKQFVVAALDAHDNNRSATARALGISRAGLYKKLRKLGLHSTLAVE